MRALDLFCGAGGATRGLQRAGFHVTGVDLKRQPRYCGECFIHQSALNAPPVFLQQFDFIWASPPCQAHTALKSMHNAKEHADLIAQTRGLLMLSGRPYVIENVVGAPLIAPFHLRGTMFGLGASGAQLLRERLFEASFPVPVPVDEYDPGALVIGVYGGHYRNRKRKGGVNQQAPDFTAAMGREAMGIDWMTGTELSQAIPPAYSEHIARAWLALQCAS